jgi:hypothetical protein
MSKLSNCKCCGRGFNHTSFPYRPGVLSPLEYACSLRCKKELVEAYTPPKTEKQKQSDDAWSKRNTHYSDGTEMSEDDKQTVSAFNSLLWLAAIGALIMAFIS